MRQFIEDAQVVFNTVRSPIYKSDSLSFHQKVFSELEDYLQANGLQYSEQTVKKWLTQPKQFSEKETAHRCSKCILTDHMTHFTNAVHRSAQADLSNSL